MLRILSSNLKSGQNQRYYGNPMGITEQCNSCGVDYETAAQRGGQLYDCETCQQAFCEQCISQHERAHLEAQL